MSSLRQHSVVVSVFASVVLSLFTLGGNVLTTCMTSISLLFLLEVDDILYQHAVPEWAKAWCSEHAAASLGAADLHTISWLRIAYTLLFATCIPGVAAVRLRLPSEGGETYSGTALTHVAVPATVAVAILVEPMALRAGRSGWRAAAGRFGRCVLRFLVGFLLWTLLLQVIDRWRGGLHAIIVRATAPFPAGRIEPRRRDPAEPPCAIAAVNPSPPSSPPASPPTFRADARRYRRPRSHVELAWALASSSSSSSAVAPACAASSDIAPAQISASVRYAPGVERKRCVGGSVPPPVVEQGPGAEQGHVTQIEHSTCRSRPPPPCTAGNDCGSCDTTSA